jgi:hypothetical protein
MRKDLVDISKVLRIANHTLVDLDPGVEFGRKNLRTENETRGPATAA